MAADQAGSTPRCSYCTDKYKNLVDPDLLMSMSDDPALNPTSRRDGSQICHACARAEFLADIKGCHDRLARAIVETDREAALKLPSGSFYGESMWPTGKIDVFDFEWQPKVTNEDHAGKQKPTQPTTWTEFLHKAL